MLAAYYEGRQIALHKLSYQKNIMVVNANHYQRLLTRHDFDTENTLLHNIRTVDFEPQTVSLAVYDE